MNSQTKQQSKPSQETAILEYLKQGKTLTQLEALSLFNCFRLGARVHRLVHKKGQEIKSVMVVRNGKRVAQYSLLR